MKAFYLTNRELITTGDALRELPTNVFPVTRAKHKLLKLIDRKFEEFAEDEKLLMSTYANKDENGEPIIKENGNYDIPNDKLRELQKEITVLADTSVTILYGEVALDIKPAIDYILTYEGHIDAKMGQGLFDLIEAYELSQQSEEEK